LDWNVVIERQSKGLKAVIATLFAMPVLADGSLMAWIPQGLYRQVLRVLGLAESALRRLIVIAARGLVVKVRPPRPVSEGLKTLKGKKGNSAKQAPFWLYDSRKFLPELARRRRKFAKRGPRVWSFDRFMAEPIVPKELAPPPKPEDDLIDATRICRRLQALKRAFEDLPGQAKRYLRWKAKRERQSLKTPMFTIPMRPGPAPGHRKIHTHEIDDILDDCHAFAWWPLKPDRS
jgi:hypothetical protein